MDLKRKTIVLRIAALVLLTVCQLFNLSDPADCGATIYVLELITVLSAKKFALLLLALGVLVQRPDNLSLYTACKLGQFVVQESAERDRPFSRSVPTANGDKPIEVAHGISLHIAYAETPFVNLKAERFGNNYANDKQVLIDSLKYLGVQEDMESAEPWPSSMNGFEVYGINHKQLAVGVLSIYLLFRDVDHTVVTLYLLNTPPEAPKFRTLDEYRVLRDKFLLIYIMCAGPSSKASPK